jgi:formate/nitrite transporter FocA (FNT family)
VSRRLRVLAAAVGVVFGFFLTGSALGDYHTIHDGLLLRAPYIYLMMVATVGTAALGIALVKRTALGRGMRLPHEPVQRKHLFGGAVFGVGFGVAATCPGITIAMTMTGGLYGLVVLAGLLLGLWLRGRTEQGTGGRR